MENASVAGDVVAAASALAGLILVYLGALVTGYSSYHPQERKSVRASHVRRARVAVGGVASSLLAASLALVGKWQAVPRLVDASVILVLVSLACGIVITYLTKREIV